MRQARKVKPAERRRTARRSAGTRGGQGGEEEGGGGPEEARGERKTREEGKVAPSMPVRQPRRGARATACAAGMLAALAAASVHEALAQRPPVLTDPTPTVKNITEFVGDALDDLCE